MQIVFPIIGYLCLATLVLASPQHRFRRSRRGAADLARDLKDRHGFVEAPDVEHVLKPTRQPPFHYGTEHRLINAVTGAMHDMPVTSATFTCRYNGSTHLYGVASLTLAHPAERLEVRAGAAFATAWVIDTPPPGRVQVGCHPFDDHFELYTPARETGGAAVLARAGVTALERVAEPFSMRIEGMQVLLWRAEGWSSSESLAAAVAAAATVVDTMAWRGSVPQAG
ncbi:hypothetical protein ABH926_007146 [Catenulispora sp. GP43]|uniref:hypothetical protein n=1 Tax=Catenulispora sp. GP43 TaxID=3156263 RepID=UPI003517CC08